MSDATLTQEELIFIGVCDLAAQVRGKSIPVSAFQDRLQQGVGYTPANICLSVFGAIGSTPFGTRGDIVLMPDASTKVHVPSETGVAEQFCLADIVTRQGKPWEFCPRNFLRRALERLFAKTGTLLLAGFEQEFIYTGASANPHRPYALTSFREGGTFGPRLVAALRSAGMIPESFLSEYGPRQFEVTVAPAIGLRAADDAVILRELARSLAVQAGHRAIFSPMLEPNGVGNGTHIHMSLCDPNGMPRMHNPQGPYGLSEMGEHFVAGILEHMPALSALTTPSVCSFYRLTPNRWAPTWANISLQDRAASLRVCPGSASNFNIECRVADATACPYLALGALVHAGVDGIERNLSLPPESDIAFGNMTDHQRREAGMRPLPKNLREALDALVESPAAEAWFGSEFLSLYVNFKREEVQAMATLDHQAVCEAYAAIF
jgi:glutamine synthetase